jgi:LytS/YehU family sensor histidine kinase
MIFNVLNSIYYLCDTDAKKAQKALGMFSDYLRGNFESLSISHLIPIDSEIRHVKGYLELEKMRFEDELQVEYDIDNLDFKIPPLSIQPIVENAVKHGLDPGVTRLTITIRTRETDSGSELAVEDNGPGFGQTDSDAPGIALENIRHRLKMMCGGRISVTPREGGGTVVTLTVPK